MKPKASKRAFEDQLFGFLFLASIPSFLLALLCLWLLELPFAAIALITIFFLSKITLIAYHIKRRFSYQVRTLSNLLEAVSNDDFSLRGRVGNAKQDPAKVAASDALTELVLQINSLADTLSNQRVEVKESQILLAKIINNIEIALVSVDKDDRVTHVNEAFCQLFNAAPDTLLSQTISDLSIDTLFEADPDLPIDWRFPLKAGRFSVYCDTFIEGSEMHRLLLIKDVKIMLRTEEQQAWHKLIRVIGHEINNSLTPISSLSASLQAMVGKPDKVELIKQSLGVIQERASGLKKLVNSYKTIAREAEPVLQRVNVMQLVENVCTLYPSLEINIICQQRTMYIRGDRHQIEQALINIIKNAKESHLLAYEAEEKKQYPAIVISIGRESREVNISIYDKGIGISNPSNLFVPFYTTKTQGSGIGLAVSRQIIEAHRGELTLENRTDSRGCHATILLPLYEAEE